MAVKLHLMDDQKIIKTTEVLNGSLANAFDVLMDHLLEVHKTYHCPQADKFKDTHNIIQHDIRKAKRKLPTSSSQVSEWNTEGFSIVIHGYNLNSKVA